MISTKSSLVARLLTCVLLLSGSATAVLAKDSAPAALPEVSAKPNRLILLDIAQSGDLLLAAAERGVILRSMDAGKTWKSLRTPTSRTLTGIALDDGALGVAVGHGGTLLRTTDSGASWQKVDVPETGPDALLGVTRIGAQRFVAYGAFGLFLESVDGGKTWKRHQIVSDDFDRHISSVIALGETQFLLVGETGTLARSSDGVNWKSLQSPYDGSWFGALTTQSGARLIFGMRGNIYRSEGGGESWSMASIDSRQAITNALQLSDGRILIVGNGGLVAVSEDDGRSFRQIKMGAPVSFSRAIQTADGRTLAVGDRGLVPLTVTE